MATGRNICSVCLEPYRSRGRQAKLLPCFHTFCLPCLRGLVTRETETPGVPGQDAEDEGRRSPACLTCPTCRRVIPVPAGGVTAFQTNLYVDTDSGEEDPQPVPCNLCDGDQQAQFQCGQCHNRFCSQCRRCHDKFCEGTQVTALQDPSDTNSSAQSPSSCQVKQQLKMVEDTLKKLKNKKLKLTQDRQAMDDSINARFAALMGHAADARDACLTSLREVCGDLTNQLHSHMAEAQQTRDTLQQQLSSSPPAPVSASQLRAALFIEGDLQMILNWSLDSASLLQHQKEDNTSRTIDSVQSFMGKIVKSSSPVQSKEASGSPSCQDDRAAVSSAGPGQQNVKDLNKKIEDLVSQVTALQAANTQLSQHVTLLSNTSCKLTSGQSALEREMTALKDRNVKLTTEQATLQREVTALKDKNVIIHQDLAMLAAEKDKACTDLAQLKKDVVSMQTEVSVHQTDMVQMKTDHGAVVSQLSSVQADVTTLQGDEASMKKDVGQLKTDCSDLKADMTASENKVASLLQRVKSAEDSLQDNRKSLTALETRLSTVNTQIAFHALLTEEVTTSTVQTLICDKTITNVGDAYDGQTGVFTAPLSGTYCFLATTSPRHFDVEKRARLKIVLDGVMKGYVFSLGMSWSTGHTVVKMNTGQKVWLETYEDREYTFSAGGWTKFSGMLVQAD